MGADFLLITDKNELKKYYSSHRVWQGIPGIEHTKGGRTFISAYSGGTDEYHGNYAFLLMSDNETDYSEPILVAQSGNKSRCFDPCIWIDPLDRLWFIWSVMPGDKVYASICENPDEKELSWSEEFIIGDGVMMNKPIVLSTGEWLFPIALWKYGISTEMRGNSFITNQNAGSYVYKTCDNGKTFIKLGYADIYNRDFDEHMVLELKNGTLMMLVRTSYGIGVSYSYDRGKNWSKGEDSKLGGPCSRFHIRRLRSGRVLLINHLNFSGRNNLTAMLSEDDGKTYPYTLLLDERMSVSYPDATEDENGIIRITYDRERGSYNHSLEKVYSCAREILTAKITEEDIINGTISKEGSYLKRIAAKLGKLNENDPDPYEKPIDDKDFAEILIETHNPENIIKCIYDKYPLNCINVQNLDAKKLDKLINEFTANGYNDIEILIKIISIIRNSPKSESKINLISERTKEYIKNHLNEELATSAIAEALNISVHYLCHKFKEETGTTITVYRNELKMTMAKLQLINTDNSITEISNKLGFGSASYFTEIFSDFEKISPSDYRKLHKK